jgi:CheY-like chemotaxis protein
VEVGTAISANISRPQRLQDATAWAQYRLTVASDSPNSALVSAVDDGQAALEAALQHPPDLVLSDIMLLARVNALTAVLSNARP